jgi:hypothetical protein
LEAFDWKVLPRDGGILDQPEALVDDLTKLLVRISVLKTLKEQGASTTVGSRQLLLGKKR